MRVQICENNFNKLNFKLILTIAKPDKPDKL
jgi:hypothetical protein